MPPAIIVWGGVIQRSEREETTLYEGERKEKYDFYKKNQIKSVLKRKYRKKLKDSDFSFKVKKYIIVLYFNGQKNVS